MEGSPTPSAGRAALLGVAFLAELCMLFGLAWAGWSMGAKSLVSVALMVLLPSAVAVVWGLWLAPRATHRLRTPARWTVKVALFAGTFLLLVTFGPIPAAGIFAVVMLLLFLVSLPADRTPRG